VLGSGEKDSGDFQNFFKVFFEIMGGEGAEQEEDPFE